MNDKQKIDSLAAVFQALSDGNRLRILEILKSEPHPICVNGLALALEISQSAVSQHLKVLKNCNLVQDRKEGYFKHYSLNRERLEEIMKLRVDILGQDFQI